MVNPAVSILGVYFKKRISIAAGLVKCGSGFGSLLFPYFMSYLIEQYGSDGAMLILGGVTLNLVVAGALMRPLKTKKKIITKTDTLPAIVPASNGISNMAFDSSSCEDSDAQEDAGKCSVFENKSSSSCTVVIKDNFASGREKAHNKITCDNNTEMGSPAFSENTDELGKRNVKSMASERHTTKKQVPFPWYLFKDVNFILYAIAVIIGYFAYIETYELLPIKADELEEGRFSNASIIGLTSIAETLFRLIWSVIWDHGIFRKPDVRMAGMGLLLALGGGFMFQCATITVNEVLGGWAVIFGSLLAGALSCFIPIAMDITGPKQVGNGYAIVQMGQGILLTVGPLFTGNSPYYFKKFLIKTNSC